MRLFQLYILIFTISTYASIGYISALRGNIYVERDGVNSMIFKGFQVENKDIIKTSRRGKVQIIFKDKTVIRIGKSSTFEVLDYLFNNKKSSKAYFRVKHGFFSVVTGKIGKLSSTNFKFKTSISTIGIRGTHFQGLIRDQKEDIACLKGSIFVEVQGKSIDILAGEILNIKAGIPSTPKNLQTIDIIQMEKASLEHIDNPEVASLKYDSYISKYISQKTQLLKNSDSSVTLEVFTFGIPIDNSYESIKNAKPFDISIYATKDDVLTDNYPDKSWNGKSKGGKIIKYSGDIIFVQDESKENEILTKNGKQKVSLTLDSQNSFVTGNFNYLDSQIRFSNSGKGAVTQNNFLHYSNNVLTGEDNSRLIFPQQGGYYSDKTIYAKLGVVDSNFFNVIKDDQVENSISMGGFIAEKVEEFDIYKQQIDSDNIFSWGYWAYKDSGIEKTRGGWIDSDLAITSKEIIAEFKDSSVKAKYSGEIIGTVENYITKIEAQKIIDGKFKVEFDFLKNKTDGNLEFSTESRKYGVDFIANDIIGDDSNFAFTSTNFDFKSSSITIPEYLHGSGQFIGDNAKNIIGGFTAGFKNGDTAVTGFKGGKEN